MGFERLPQGSADAFEREVLDGWKADDLFHQTLEANRDAPPFVFYEGPPTANGRPGIHHVFARTIKDLICRFQSQNGRSVTRIAGWDTHGLPVEIEVEKALNINGKADIERFGVAEFNQRCRESVFRYKNDWESLSDRIGYWLDYERPYVTYTNEYIESVWWLLKQLWERNRLYEGHKVLPYCARCGTSLSSHELSMGYETHRSPSIYALFRLEDDAADGAPRHLLVWTTTPWTLPSNVAVAVHPDFTYVEVDVEGTRVIVEETIARRLAVPGATAGEPLSAFPVVAEHSGRELVGRRYHQLLDAVSVDRERAFRVLAGDFVTRDEGTGVVHMAPAFGGDDFAAIQAADMAFVNPVDEGGRFAGTAWDAIEGQTVFDANPIIAERLEREGALFGRYDPQGYEHTYPFCWRCHSPLIYYARRSWFVRTTDFKDRMVAFNEAVRWCPPEVGEGRFGEWLANNVDWALSRDRFWGTPLPAWICSDDREHRVVVGSFDELATRQGSPLPADFDPHKPFIDNVVLPCPTCGGTMHRVAEVIDAWFDSGAMPFAQWHYPFEHQEEHQAHFPADYICEGLDQTRGWFYSLLAIAAGVTDQPAYRNVIVNGLVLDADGRKMSKHVGNVVNPWETIEEFGADAVRLYMLASSQVWLAKRFDASAIPDVAVGFLTRLRNSYDFFAQYAGEWTPETPAGELTMVDRWLRSRLDGVVAAVREAWSTYDVTTGTKTLMDFADQEVSNWYIRINRARFWAPDGAADPAAMATLFDALVTLTRLLAPAAPFLSDAIHRRLTGESVHLAAFPETRGEVDDALDASMAAVRRLASLARNAREEAGLKVRQPLARMQVAVPRAVRGDRFNACLDLLSREVNVKSIEVVDSDADLVRLRGKPNFRTLGKVYQQDTPRAAAAATTLTREQLLRLEDGETVTATAGGRDYAYRPDDVVIEREVASAWLVQSEGAFVVALDPDLSEALRHEGLARELVNRVQRLRKNAGYDYTTRIALGVRGPEPVLAAAGAFSDFVSGETLARRFALGDEIADADLRETVDLDGAEAVITLRRHEGSG